MLLVLFGAPGVGKGTQCKRLTTDLAIPHISTGEMLRAEIGSQTELGKQASEYINQGSLVPDGIVVAMVGKRLGQSDCEAGCLLDGFPRTVEQAKSLDELLEKAGRSIDKVIELHVDEAELRRRLLERAKIEGRADDTPEAIDQRFQVYQAQTSPLVDYYTNRGVRQRIDGVGTPDEVYGRIRNELSLGD